MGKSFIHSFFENITPGMFRLFLALLVVMYHSVAFLAIGHYAVYVFFVLSGYWIFKMFTEKYAFYEKPYWVYLRSRLLRLLPIYFIVLVFGIGVFFTIAHYISPELYPQAHLIKIFLLNFFILGISNSPVLFIGPAWSLDVELQFYILAPMLLFLCTAKKYSSILLFIITSIFCLLGMYYATYVTHMQNIILNAPFFLMGGIIYLKKIEFSKEVAFYCFMAVFAILGIIYIVPSFRIPYILNHQPTELSFWNSLNIVFTVLTLPFVSVNVRQKKSAKTKNDSLWSSMSFVIYLLHWPLLLIYACTVKNVSGLNKLIHLGIFYIGCWFFSYLMSKYVDAFFENKRHLWLGKQKKSVSNTPIYAKA